MQKMQKIIQSKIKLLIKNTKYKNLSCFLILFVYFVLSKYKIELKV